MHSHLGLSVILALVLAVPIVFLLYLILKPKPESVQASAEEGIPARRKVECESLLGPPNDACRPE